MSLEFKRIIILDGIKSPCAGYAAGRGKETIMNDINLINLKIDTNMDADDYGKRIVDVLSNIKNLTHEINLIKIKLGENISQTQLSELLLPLTESFRLNGVTNFVFVPLIPGLIEDITVDKVEVIHVESK